MADRVAPLIYATVKDTSGNSERIHEGTYKLLSLQYTDSKAKADKAILTVDNNDLSNFDDPVWAHRNAIQLSWGYPNNMALTRELIITKVTGGRILKVEAKATSVVMDAVKKSKTYKDTTRSEVVKIIAASYGFAAERTFIEDTYERLDFITQAGISDAQFIRKLAHQQGFDFYVDHDGFHWKERKLIQTPVRAFQWFTDPGRGDLLDFSVENDVTKRPAKVTKTVRDPETKKEVKVTASDDTDTNREGTGSVLLIKEADLKSGTLVYVPEEASPAATAQTAGVEAAAKFRAAQRGAVKMVLTSIGDPTMLAKTLVTVSGLGQRLSGNYFVNEVVHDVSAGSYKMTLKVASDGMGAGAKKKDRGLENGLPDVTPVASRAKRTDEKAQTGGGGLNPANTRDPDALVPVPILDANGVAIGTAWKERSQVAVTIANGKATAG